MVQRALRAVFMRGGTSKGLMLHAGDLPADREAWTDILCGAMGSPDVYGRQLDGMGGGVTSLSKACVIAAPTREDADVDYTFAQVMIGARRVEYRSNCGNMSSAVGPFALDEGLVAASASTGVVRIHNTNTAKIIRATFEVRDGRAHYDGDLVIPGLSAPGSAIRLDFLEPGGATTGQLLPTGRVRDEIHLPGRAPIDVSLVDAANATVFVDAAAVGLAGTELPSDLEQRRDVLTLLEDLRRHASVAMGITADLTQAAAVTSVPFVCVVSSPQASSTLSGEVLAAAEVDLVARAISNGQPHRALPLTVALCTAVAARLEGTVVADATGEVDRELRVAMPSGVVPVDADVEVRDGDVTALSGSFYRTARRLFDGRVWYRA